jgi:hypothetical protein
MIDEFTVRHHEHISARSFDEVIAAFEAAVGSVEDGGIEDDAGATRSLSDFEARIQSREGASGFMRFLTIDHGAWLARNGLDAKARMYTIGNPLIAWTMIKHDLWRRPQRADPADDLRGRWQQNGSLGLRPSLIAHEPSRR